MVRCSNPVLLRCYAAIKAAKYSRACPTPGSTVDQTSTSFEMCQNSNDFCRENNTFAKYSQESRAKRGLLTQRRKDAKENRKERVLGARQALRLCVFA